MTFHCRDLPDFGLILVPNTSPEYDGLLADIQRRIDSAEEPLHRALVGRIAPEKRATSAILLNQSTKTIAEMGLTWHYEDAAGRTFIGASHKYGGVRNLPESLVRILGYWRTIFPGSKRYLGEDGIAGDNTDVRPPAPDEIWKSGVFAGSGGGGVIPAAPIRSVTLNLNGVLFSDGSRLK